MAISQYEIKVKPKLPLIAKWCRSGFTDKEIWNRLGIEKSSYYGYQNKFPEFRDTVHKTKNIVMQKLKINFIKIVLDMNIKNRHYLLKKKLYMKTVNELKKLVNLL